MSLAVARLPWNAASQPTNIIGVALSLIPGDVSLKFEVQRAPDVSGAPGTPITIGQTGPFSQAGGIYIDQRPGTTAVWWYRIRHVGVTVDPGPYSGYVSSTAYPIRREIYDAWLNGTNVYPLSRPQPWSDGSYAVQASTNDGQTVSSPVKDSSGTRTINRFLAKQLVGDVDTLDGVPEGTTYNRPLATRINAGRPLIDFSEAIHSNKQLDNIADGSTFKRLLNVSSGLAQTGSLADSAVTAPKVGAALGGGNLMQNASFEANVNDVWNLYNNGPESATWSTITAGGALHGSRFVRVAWTTANSSQKGVYQNGSAGFPGNVPFRTGVWFTVSWYAKVGSALSCGMQNNWNHNPDVTVAVQNPNLSTTWQRYIFRVFWNNGSTPDTGAFISIASGLGGANVNLDIDAVQVEEGDLATGFKMKPDEMYTTERSLISTVQDSSGTRALNLFLAKPLVGSADSLDGTADGSTYLRSRRIVSSSVTAPTQILFSALNGSTTSTTEVSIASYTLPAGLLSQTGDAIHVRVLATTNSGSGGEHWNVKFGGTIIFSGSLAAGNWIADIYISRTGATTQNVGTMCVTTNGTPGTGAVTTAAETLANALVVDFRAQANNLGGSSVKFLAVSIEFLGV